MLNDDDLQRMLAAQKLYLRKSGFTLIELLVVIAVVALLMGILMPVLSKARKQAKTVICQSNLHQWGLTFLMYTTDNDQDLYVVTAVERTSVPGSVWPGRIHIDTDDNHVYIYADGGWVLLASW